MKAVRETIVGCLAAAPEIVRLGVMERRSQVGPGEPHVPGKLTITGPYVHMPKNAVLRNPSSRPMVKTKAPFEGGGGAGQAANIQLKKDRQIPSRQGAPRPLQLRVSAGGEDGLGAAGRLPHDTE